MLNVGDKVPDLLGTDENSKEIRLSDFPGKKVALYFYPKDMTSGCTAQACSLRDGYGELLAAGYQVVGVSVDSAESHRKFIAKNNLPFPLIPIQITVWSKSSAYGVRNRCTAANIWVHSAPLS